MYKETEKKNGAKTNYSNSITATMTTPIRT